jgi:elongation factor P
MGSMNDITRGSTLRLNDQLWEVVEHLHARTGMRKPTVKAKMRNLITGKVIEHQFRPTDTVDFVRIDTKPMEYLYREGQNFVFMDHATFEQPIIEKKYIEPLTPFLLEGMNCEFRYEGETIVGVALPDIVEIEVTDAPPHIKGDTANAEYRAVTIATGAEIKVPPFIQQGEMIKIDTRTGDYVGRAKS